MVFVDTNTLLAKIKHCVKQSRITVNISVDSLRPTIVLVHGYMPDNIFAEFAGQVEFHRYKSEFERTHEMKEGV